LWSIIPAFAQWGFCYTLTKEGINQASADVGFMFIAYNLRRIISKLGRDHLMKYLRIPDSLFSTVIACIRQKISYPEAMIIQKIIWSRVNMAIA